MKSNNVAKYLSLLKNYYLSKVNKKPYKLNLFITDKCNSRCKNCFIWKKVKKDFLKNKKELELDEFKKIFKNLPKNFFWLAITGGEPYLRNDIYKIIFLAKRNIPNLKIISIPSNGLDREKTLKVIQRLVNFKDVLFYLSFSIDGPRNIHNKIRGVNDAYNRTMETYRAVQSLTEPYKNFHIFLQATISKYNSSYLYDYFDQMINKHKSKDDFVITIFHEAPLYRNRGVRNLSNISRKDISRIINVISKSKKGLTPKNYIQKKYLKGLNSYIVNKRNIINCMALQDSFSINNYGEISPCLMWDKNLGNLKNIDYNINKFWNTKAFSNTRNEIRKKECPGCWTPCEAYQSIISNLIANKIILRKKF